MLYNKKYERKLCPAMLYKTATAREKKSWKLEKDSFDDI